MQDRSGGHATDQRGCRGDAERYGERGIGRDESGGQRAEPDRHEDDTAQPPDDDPCGAGRVVGRGLHRSDPTRRPVQLSGFVGGAVRHRWALLRYLIAVSRRGVACWPGVKLLG